ncbi:hypothetical protein SAMN04487969_1273 [Paenibacillus algorifonticola]|uniref:tRNA nuclease CdiA C-terminal domain-containing protein n=1 Tax=Paenibacillus algorifonticola TaxID=684063 RepID=A0A1I2HVD9_9BACL|nr:hypothetical protein [Paenibacillus algorifonticola]SFF33340.1 hypothetical protein SAMN04487969_1273 [Paenibacillus algorifonticola]
MATSDQATLGSLMVQFEETDWQFLKRLASRVGTVILPDVVMDTPRVYFGVPDLSWGKELKAKRYTVLKNRAAYEELKAHAEGSDADLIHEADFVSYRITSEQFCQVGDDVVFKKQMWVVAESVISYASGLLTYEYVLVRRQTLRRKSRQNEGIQGVSLEGRVVKRANNMVKVHLDIDNANDEQGNWWFPYSGEGNNLFHVLPDEGARIKVYFPNGVEKKAMAINSVRGGSEEMKSRTVFQKPTTKVFETPGAAKMQLGDDGVLFEKGTVSLHLDGGNITVNATEDVLLVAGNKVELGSGSDKGILESIRMRATSQVALQTNSDQYVLISDNRVGIKSGKLDFQKVEVPFTELLTDEEIEQMYLDEQLSEQLATNMEQEKQKHNGAPISEEYLYQKVHPATKEQIKNDPNLGAKAKDWIKTQSTEKQQEFYQNRYGPKSSEPSKDKEAELARRQQAYDQQERDRTAVHNWNQEVAAISKRGRKEGKSLAEIQSMLPAPPVLSSSPPKENMLSGMIHEVLNAPGVQSFLEQMAPALEAWQLENMIPQKPDYLSKQTAKTVYLSRYTYEELILGPQMLIAEFNIIFGVIAIIAAIPTGGGSLYLLVVADVAFGAAMIWVNAEKLMDLRNGDDSTNPSILGIDQSMLDKLGIALTVVNLGILLKHGLYAAVNKLANGRNIAALDDTWTKFKLENVKPPKPKEPPAPPKTKTKTKEPTKDGPGVNQPIDEFDDAVIYQGAGKGRSEPPNATGGKVEGTGDSAKIPKTGPEWDEYFRSKYGDQNVDWKTSSEYKLYGEKHIPYTPKIRPNAIITKPSLPKGGKPEGNYAKDTGKDARGLKRQNEAADVLAEQGYRTTMLDEFDDGNGYGLDPKKSPDFIIEGQVFDCYSPNSTNLSNILRMLRDKTTDQARRIVLNLNDYPVDKRSELIGFLLSQTQKDLKHLDELLIIEGRQVTRAYWRYE